MNINEIKSALAAHRKETFQSYDEEHRFLLSKGIRDAVVALRFFEENGGNPSLYRIPQKINVRGKETWCIVLEKKQVISMPDEETDARSPRKSDLADGRRIFLAPKTVTP